MVLPEMGHPSPLSWRVRLNLGLVACLPWVVLVRNMQQSETILAILDGLTDADGAGCSVRCTSLPAAFIRFTTSVTIAPKARLTSSWSQFSCSFAICHALHR
jgi:hypothetical protein